MQRYRHFQSEAILTTSLYFLLSMSTLILLNGCYTTKSTGGVLSKKPIDTTTIETQEIGFGDITLATRENPEISVQVKKKIMKIRKNEVIYNHTTRYNLNTFEEVFLLPITIGSWSIGQDWRENKGSITKTEQETIGEEWKPIRGVRLNIKIENINIDRLRTSWIKETGSDGNVHIDIRPYAETLFWQRLPLTLNVSIIDSNVKLPNKPITIPRRVVEDIYEWLKLGHYGSVQ